MALIVGGERMKRVPVDDGSRLRRAASRRRTTSACTTSDTPTAGSMLRVKGQDGFCPIGPELATRRRSIPTDIAFRTYVNGEVVQEGNTGELLLSFAYMLADLSRLITLEPGDMLLSGTPANSRPVEPGDSSRSRWKASGDSQTGSSRARRSWPRSGLAGGLPECAPCRARRAGGDRVNAASLARNRHGPSHTGAFPERTLEAGGGSANPHPGGDVSTATATVAGVEVSPDHLIGGERVSSAETFADISPIDERTLADIARGGAAEANRGRRGGARGVSRLGRARPRGPRRASLPHRRPDRGARGELAQSRRSTTARSSRPRGCALMKRARDQLPLLRPAGARPGEPHVGVERYEYRVRHDPSGVAVADHAVERADACSRPGRRPGARGRLHRGPEASRVVAAHRARCSRTFAAEAGLPPGVLNVVQGYGEEVGAALTAHPGVSPHLLHRLARDRLGHRARRRRRTSTPVSFELGGKSAVPRLRRRRSRRGGRERDLPVRPRRPGLPRRDAPPRGAIDRGRVHERFLAGVSERKLGDPREQDTDIGPAVTREHLARVDGFVERAIADGAKLGSAGASRRSSAASTTSRRSSPMSARTWRSSSSEVFGPVLTLQTFEEEDEGVELANATEFGLAATLFTEDEARMERLGRAARAGHDLGELLLRP